MRDGKWSSRYQGLIDKYTKTTNDYRRTSEEEYNKRTEDERRRRIEYEERVTRERHEYEERIKRLQEEKIRISQITDTETRTREEEARR